jgi:parvulin-like peptidyl-prolyl isomerase
MRILNRLKAEGQVGFDSSIGMDDQQRLERAKMWFENAEASMNAISNDAKMGYESYLKSVDEQMELYREELRRIDEELKKVEDEDKRSKLLEEGRE